MKSITKSPALVVSIIAVVLALGGTATAAYKLSGKQLRNHSVAAKKLTKAAKRSLKSGPAVAGPAGPAGPPGVSLVLADNSPVAVQETYERVLEVPIGPGSWSAQVNLEVHPKGKVGQVECRFRAPASADNVLLGFTGVQFLGDDPAQGFFDSRFLSYAGAFTNTEPGVVEMICKSGPGAAVESFDGDLVVTKVGEVRADN